MLRGRGTRLAGCLAAVIAFAVSACVPAPPIPTGPDPGPGAGGALLAIRATRGPHAALVDSAGREVTLRGANVNQLGDYFVTDPRLPTVASLDEADWDDAQAMGFNVVRLVTTWSSWEPQRGRYDDAYLARVRAAVAQANAHGMYVLLDLHQDAWSKFVYAPAGHVCPDGWSRTRGWDGAPSWATFTDAAETCSPDGRRESSPAVIVAWDSFYANREGIRDSFAHLWGHLATAFAGNPGIAGFDLLNEPGMGSSWDGTVIGLTATYRQAIVAIRDAEDRVGFGAPGHAVFVEPVSGGFPLLPFDLTDDDNVVLAPHTYAESFDDVPGLLDLSLAMYALAGRVSGMPVFLGEYGAYRDASFNREWASRVHRLLDEEGYVGDTWWQWEQACGDPHNTFFPMPDDEVRRRLPSCADARSPQACPTRPYPRAVPGRIESIASEPCGSGPVEVTGSTVTPGTADLWFPSLGAEPVVAGERIASVRVDAVAGGYRVFVGVDGEFRIRVTDPVAER